MVLFTAWRSVPKTDAARTKFPTLGANHQTTE